MLAILLATYGTVFVAEIVGDKLLYTTGVLATRYRATHVMVGMLLAFMGKMAVAVLVGAAISQLPPLFVALITAINFFAIGYTLWRKPDKRDDFKKKEYRASQAAIVSFAAIFFSEWGDVGQLTAATMAARYGSPLMVWIGAVAAMVTKGAFAAWAGAEVRKRIQSRISPKTVRYAGVGLLSILGSLTVIEILFYR